MTEGKRPVWAICADERCAHQWIFAYLPMEALKFAVIGRNARCLMCGGSKIYFKAGDGDASTGDDKAGED